MHELSLSQAILDTALRHADGRPVTTISLRIGALRQVVPDSLDFYFDILAQGTLCEGAELEVDEIPATLHCSGCAREWEVAEARFRCPRCADGRVEIVRGREFEVESILVEEEQCTAPR